MNAVDEVRAAIEKLTELKESTRYFEVNGWLCEGQPGDMVRDYFHPDGGPTPLTNDPIIVTLHRTIAAQLAILADTLRALRDPLFGAATERVYAYQIDLAHVICGVTS